MGKCNYSIILSDSITYTILNTNITTKKYHHFIFLIQLLIYKVGYVLLNSNLRSC